MPCQDVKLTSIPRKVVVGPLPVDGNQPKITAKSIIIIIPTQKVGRLKPKMEAVIIDLEVTEFGRRPASIPSGIPITTASSSAKSASSNVAGMRSKISSNAGSSKIKESPRFPWAALRRNSKYWM